MPLFVKCTSAPTFTEFKEKDYPIAFDTTYSKIHIPNYLYTGRDAASSTYSFDCRYVWTPYANPVATYSYVKLHPTGSNTYDGITIYHKLFDEPTCNGASSGYLITSIGTDGYGHISSYKKTSAGIKNIVTASSLPSSPDSNTLYLIT